MSRARCGIFPVGYVSNLFGQPVSPYALVQSKCHYSVVDVNVHARLTQTYVSTATQAQEVMYVFPLPSDAAVCAFNAVIDDKRTIHGVVKKKAEAKRDYDAAVAQGKTAGLLDQHTADVFQISLGNLKPRQKIAVNISFVSVVSHDGKLDSLRLTLPLSIAPNYGAPPAGLMQIHSFLHGKSAPFELTMSFSMTSNIMSVTSQTHPIGISLGMLDSESDEPFDPTKAHVALSSSSLLDKDVVVVLRCEKLDHPRGVVERAVRQDGASDAVALTLVPRFDVPPLAAQEYIFLIDRSGSMGGGRIAAVRAALQIMLRSLPSRGTRFNLLSFGSRVSGLWPASVEYCADSVQTATAHVDAMNADYGGTDIRGALQYAFDSRPEDKREQPAMVLLLTDGEAWDVQGVVKETETAVEMSKGALRVFVLGVGDQVSTNMCNAIARAGRGVASFVGEHEKPDAKLINMLKAARGPAVTDISVDWGVPLEPSDAVDSFELVDADEAMNVNVEAAPAPAPPPPAQPISLFSNPPAQQADVEVGPKETPLPPVARIQQSDSKKAASLYPGFRASLYAIIRQPSPSAPLPTNVTVTGNVLGTPVTLAVPLTTAATAAVLPGEQPVDLIHVLAARSFVQALEDESNKTPLVKGLVARLATTYGITSSQTSFVAVDEEGDAASPPGAPAATPVLMTATAVGAASAFGSAPGIAAQPAQFTTPFGGAFGAPTSGGLYSAPTGGGHFSAPTSGGLFSAPMGGGLFGSAAPTGSAAFNFGPYYNVNTTGSAQVQQMQMMEFQQQQAPFGAGVAGLGGPARQSVSSGFGGFGQPASSSFGAFGQPAQVQSTSPFGGSAFQPQAQMAPQNLFGQPARAAPTVPGNTVQYEEDSVDAAGYSPPSPASHALPTVHPVPPPVLFSGPQSFSLFSTPPIIPAAHSMPSGGMFGQPQAFAIQSQSASRLSQPGQSLAATPPSQPAFGQPTPMPAGLGAPSLFGSPPVILPPPAAPTATLSGRPSGPPTVELLARQQQFDGSFGAKDWYYDFISASAAAASVPASLSSLDGLDDQTKDTLWCTVVTIAYLAKAFTAEKDAWVLMGDKANDFVVQTLTADARLDLKRAESLVSEWVQVAKNAL